MMDVRLDEPIRSILVVRMGIGGGRIFARGRPTERRCDPFLDRVNNALWLRLGGRNTDGFCVFFVD